MGRSQYRFCPAGPDSFGSMCAEQGKPQRYQYRIYGNQRVLGAADGGNCCACHVPYFRSVRNQLIYISPDLEEQVLSESASGSVAVQLQAGANYIGIIGTDYSGAIQITVE